MNNNARIILAIASLALLVAYVTPLWSISLEAPQYPEGLGMEIHVNNITGQEKHDLKKINQLNHYIGMREISPASFPELQWMPWIIGALIGIGLMASMFASRWMLYGWVAMFVATAGFGLYRFYTWAYDYGHNLDPTAAIKVPGMTYQPPVIGSKQLLNFTAHSWPGIGGWIVILAGLTGLVLTIYTIRTSNKKLAPAVA